MLPRLVGLSLLAGWAAAACPDWGPMKSFYREGVASGRYLGRWWLQDRHSDLADLAGNCWSQVYSVNYVNRTINRQTDYRTPIGNWARSDSGLVNIASLEDPNLLTLTQEQGPLPGSSHTYRVLATDYETFTIEYSCRHSELLSRNEKIWIYTRERKPSRTVLKRAYKSLKLLGLSGWKLKKTDQTCKPAATLRRISRRKFSAPPRARTQGRGARRAGLLEGGLKLAQQLFTPWTLHPALGWPPRPRRPA